MSLRDQAEVTAFAPATVANVAVGFDILGFPVEGAGDEVTVSALPGRRDVEIREISGVVSDLPADPGGNTAAVALMKMIEELRLDHGFAISIKKGIPLSSGMGGSAASAVAAVVAANGLLPNPLPKERLLPFALAGEAVASGSIHGDNVGPCLFGGLVLALPSEPMRMIRIPVPEEVRCVLVHPRMRIETRQARSILKPELALGAHVRQSACLAGFIAGCFQGDLGLIRESMVDLVVEPQRARLIPGFDELKARALEAGALGFSISGAGPSVFAWTDGIKAARKLQEDLSRIFARHQLKSDSWVSAISQQGARIIS